MELALSCLAIFVAVPLMIVTALLWFARYAK
jgi:hypothetical protein